MAITRFLLPTFLLALQAQSYALPEPQVAAATAKPGPHPTRQARAVEITARAIPQNFTPSSTDPAVLASNSAQLDSIFSEVYAEASAAEAVFESAIQPHLQASESAFLAARQSQWTRTVGASAGATSFHEQVIPGKVSASVARGTASLPGGNIVAQPTSAWAMPSKAPYDSNSKSYDTGAYEATCLDSSKYELKTHDIDYLACADVEQAICASLNSADQLVTDQWVWADKGQGCAMGYWLPKVGTNPAAIPPEQFCKRYIFDQAYRYCIPSRGGGGRWNAVSMNVERLPVWNDAGQQNDPSRMSILVAGSPYPCGLQDCHYVPTT